MNNVKRFFYGTRTNKGKHGRRKMKWKIKKAKNKKMTRHFFNHEKKEEEKKTRENGREEKET